MLSKKIVFVLISFLSFQVHATPIEILLEGDVFLPIGSGFDPTSTTNFSALISYDTDTANLEPGSAPTFAKYGPISIFFTVGAETASLIDARLNIDIFAGSFEGFQWVDDGAAWSGTLFGSTVDTLAINFGRVSTTGLSLDIVTNVDLNEWEYHNGCFNLSSTPGDETCFNITKVSTTAVPEPSSIILMLLGLAGMARVAGRNQY